jgi:hypothetical protein
MTIFRWEDCEEVSEELGLCAIIFSRSQFSVKELPFSCEARRARHDSEATGVKCDVIRFHSAAQSYQTWFKGAGAKKTRSYYCSFGN